MALTLIVSPQTASATKDEVELPMLDAAISQDLDLTLSTGRRYHGPRLKISGEMTACPPFLMSCRSLRPTYSMAVALQCKKADSLLGPVVP